MNSNKDKGIGFVLFDNIFVAHLSRRVFYYFDGSCHRCLKLCIQLLWPFTVVSDIFTEG